MSFREKSAWIFLISILLVGGFFFLHVPWTLRPSADPRLAGGLFYCVVALVVIEVIAHVVIAIRAPEDARTPRDERERLIDLKAIRAAHYVYVTGTLLAVATLHLGGNAVAMGYGVVLALVIGEAVKNGTRILLHRRGI